MYNGIHKHQRMSRDLATGKQYDYQIGAYVLYLEGNFISTYHGHLAVEEYCIALAHGHKSESLFRGHCCYNRISRSFQQSLFVIQDRLVIGNTQNESLGGEISRDHIGPPANYRPNVRVPLNSIASLMQRTYGSARSRDVVHTLYSDCMTTHSAVCLKLITLGN